MARWEGPGDRGHPEGGVWGAGGPGPAESEDRTSAGGGWSGQLRGPSAQPSGSWVTSPEGTASDAYETGSHCMPLSFVFLFF